MYNKSLAVKIVKKGQPRNLDEALQELEDGELGDAEAVIMWEVHVLRELERHDHIVRFLGGCVQRDNLCILFEFCPQSLFDLLRSAAAPLAPKLTGMMLALDTFEELVPLLAAPEAFKAAVGSAYESLKHAAEEELKADEGEGEGDEQEEGA